MEECWLQHVQLIPAGSFSRSSTEKVTINHPTGGTVKSLVTHQFSIYMSFYVSAAYDTGVYVGHVGWYCIYLYILYKYFYSSIPWLLTPRFPSAPGPSLPRARNPKKITQIL